MYSGSQLLQFCKAYENEIESFACLLLLLYISFSLKKFDPSSSLGGGLFLALLIFLSKMHYIVKGVLRMKALSETSGKGVTSISLLSWLNKGLQLYFPWVFDTACKYSLLIWNAFPRSGIFGFAKMV